PITGATASGGAFGTDMPGCAPAFEKASAGTFAARLSSGVPRADAISFQSIWRNATCAPNFRQRVHPQWQGMLKEVPQESGVARGLPLDNVSDRHPSDRLRRRHA